MILSTARTLPLSAPCLSMACTAYREQDGSKRQRGGSPLLRVIWYNRMGQISSARVARPTNPGCPPRSSAGPLLTPRPLDESRFAQLPCEGSIDALKVHATGLYVGAKHQVHRLGLGIDLPSGNLTDPAANPVANNSATNAPARHNTKARDLRLAAPDLQDARVSTVMTAPTENLTDLRTPAQAPQPSLLARAVAHQADSLTRPRCLRRLMTRRPPGLDIRARKPCLRLRRRLLGW